jgi:uncharacterized CHY-type Zn-finger protein
MGVKVVIGPVFYESISYLDEIKDITFLSLTNKTLGSSKKCSFCRNKFNLSIQYNKKIY